MIFEEKAKKYYKSIIVKKNIAGSFPSVPRFVSEYLIMGLIDDEGQVSNFNLRKIADFITKNRPDPKDYEVWKNKFIELKENQLIDIYRVQVDLSVSPPIRKCIIPFLKKESPIQIKDEIVENFENLLREGIWGLGTIKHTSTKNPHFKTNLVLENFKPFELTHFLFKQYVNGREHFTLDEWIDLLLNTVGLDPLFYPIFNQKLLILSRLIPIVEYNTHIIELGPKETGKSYLMENISPNVYNIQPSDVTLATLFYDSRIKQVGLLGLKDVIVFDEFIDVPLRQDSKEIPSKLRSFLSDGKFKKGDKEVYSRCSIFLMGNILCDENLKPLDKKYVLSFPKEWQDGAMLDRFSGLIYGWELKKLSTDAFSKSFGFAADYFHKVLGELRKIPFRINIERRVDIKNFNKAASTRTRNAILSITSGILKLLYPNEKYSKEDLKIVLDFAVKLRTQLYSQLKYIDEEYKTDLNLNYSIRWND